MKSLILLATILAAIPSTTMAQAGGGTSGHGADVVHCQSYDERFGSWPAEDRPPRIEANGPVGYFSWDWMQMGMPELAQIQGGSAEDYLVRIERILSAKLPELGLAFSAFRRSIGNSGYTADETGVLRRWLRAAPNSHLPIQTPPDVQQDIPRNCGSVPIWGRNPLTALPIARVISRTETGQRVFTYTYQPELLDVLRAQRNPQYSLVLLHEFLRDARPVHDAAIWTANILLHSSDAERMSSRELKQTLEALGVATGDSADDREELDRLPGVQQAYREGLASMNAAIDSTTARLTFVLGGNLGDSHRQEFCRVKDTLRRAFRNVVDRAASRHENELERELTRLEGVQAVLGSWVTVASACAGDSSTHTAPDHLPGFSERMNTLFDTEWNSGDRRRLCNQVRTPLFDKLRQMSVSDVPYATWTEASRTYWVFLRSCVFPHQLIESSPNYAVIHVIGGSY